MKCPSCGASNTDEFQRCKECGTYISPLYQEQRDKTTPDRIAGAEPDRGSVDPERINASLRTLGPFIAGTMLLLSSIGAIVIAYKVYTVSLEINDLYEIMPTSSVEGILKMTLLISPFGMVGGVAAMLRRNYAYANVGCIAVIVIGFILFIGFALAAFIAWAIIAASRGEFPFGKGMRQQPRTPYHRATAGTWLWRIPGRAPDTSTAKYFQGRLGLADCRMMLCRNTRSEGDIRTTLSHRG